jgi:hypothetical protein
MNIPLQDGAYSLHPVAHCFEAPCSPPQADSKCKEVIPFYCSSLANPVRLRRTTGNALAVAFSTTILLYLVRGWGHR